MAVLDATPNSISANFGKIVRSNPTIPPTNALTITKIVNWIQFSLSPSLMFFDIVGFGFGGSLYNSKYNLLLNKIAKLISYIYKD